jgi:hypothetical protein
MESAVERDRGLTAPNDNVNVATKQAACAPPVAQNATATHRHLTIIASRPRR